ncbi:hypothetical protein ACQ4PT_014405 [Festuca glaucescens]
MARRISKLVHEGLTGIDLTLSWFTRRIQPLRYNRRLICAYTGVDDPLRVTKDNLPADSLNKRIRTLVKVTRGQVVPEISKDIYINGNCPPLNTLAEEDFWEIFRIAATDSGKAEETPEEDEEEQTEKYAPRPLNVLGVDPPDPTPVPTPRAPPRSPKLLRLEAHGAWIPSGRSASASTCSRLLEKEPGPNSAELNQKVVPSRSKTQKTFTTFFKTSPTVVAPNTPVIPPSTSTAIPQQTPADPQPSPDAAGEQAPKEVIPVSSGRKDESCSGNFRAAAEETKDKEESEVSSADKAEAPANDALVFPPETDPSDCHATPKAYATKFFHKLTEAEKWELEQDLLNSLLNNAWSKVDSQSYEIEQHKRKTCELLDGLIIKHKEQQALHYELHKNIALQRRVSLRQAELLEDEKAKVAALEKKLEENQGADLKSSLEYASSKLVSLRSANKDLESKLKEAEEKQKLADDQLVQKSSEFIRIEADFQEKRDKDAEVIKKLQSEVKSLRPYMSRAEAGWDLLNSEIHLDITKNAANSFLVTIS